MRTVAESNLKKLLYVILAIVAALGIGTWYPQFAQSYGVKNAGNLACNDLIKNTHYGVGTTKNHEDDFISLASVAGVILKKQDFEFKVEHQPNRSLWLCSVKVHYNTQAEIPFIGDVLQLEPFKFKKFLHIEHDVPDSY